LVLSQSVYGNESLRFGVAGKGLGVFSLVVQPMNSGGLPRVRPVSIAALVNAASNVIGREHRQFAPSFWSELFPGHRILVVVDDRFELLQEFPCD